MKPLLSLLQVIKIKLPPALPLLSRTPWTRNHIMANGGHKFQFSTHAGQRNENYFKRHYSRDAGQLQRGWQMHNVPLITAGGNELTVMSYNILAQDLIDAHRELYRCHNHSALRWPKRYDLLIAEINHVRPDILCVQELQEDHKKQFNNGLAHFKYQMAYKKRTGCDKTDGCAIYFRSDLFTLLSRQDVEYYQPSVKVLDRENVAIILKLALKSNPELQIVVATTHLLYNPRRQDIRLAQLQLLLAELDRLAWTGNSPEGVPLYNPIILSGDFNLQPYSAPYELLSKGCLKYDHLLGSRLESSNGYSNGITNGKTWLPDSLGITDRCQHQNLESRETGTPSQLNTTKLHHSSLSQRKENDQSPTDTEQQVQPGFSTGTLSHRFLFSSAYPHNMGMRRTSTTFQDRWITVDYIFYTPLRHTDNRAIDRTTLSLVATYELPDVSGHNARSLNIPNMQYGSDHFSLAARFLLQKVS